MTDKPHPAAVDVAGSWYLSDAKASLVPISMVKAEDLLMDELVRSMVGKANALSAELTAFKQQAFERVGELQALLAQQYEAKIGGKKGNITLTAYDGRQKIQVSASPAISCPVGHSALQSTRSWHRPRPLSVSLRDRASPPAMSRSI